MEVANQNHSSGGILQNSVLKNLAKLIQNTCAGVSFSIRLIHENTFVMEYLQVTASSRSSEELFRKYLKNSQENTPEEVLFNNVADSRLKTLRSYNEDVFLQNLRTYQNNFSLEIFLRLPLDGVYSFC